MRNKLLAFLREQALIRPGDRVVCALSGGPDSVAMTHALLGLRKELGITLSACHMNHCLRGEDSDGDEAFCRALCEAWALPLTVERRQVSLRADATGESPEEAARACRYAFFARQEGLIATAHTADDQTETVLLQMVRGTGLKGLCGIPPRRDRIIRPMLSVTRQEVLDYLAEQDLPCRTDETNLQDLCLRNRIRHHVVPLLKEENPALCRNILRMTEYLRDDELLLEQQAEALLRQEGGGWALAPLRDAPRPLRRRALRKLLSDLPVAKLSATHIEAAEALILGTEGTRTLVLPGGKQLRRSYDRLFSETAVPPESFPPVSVTGPGKYPLGTTGLVAVIREGRHKGIPFPADLPETVLRPRRSGDVIRLPGGTKTLKKLLIDRKIPAPLRDILPVLVFGETILAVWSVGCSRDLAQEGGSVYTLSIETTEGEVWQI